MTASWSEASPSVIHTAQELINDHHEHLHDARICFVYRSEESTNKGRAEYASVQLIQPKLQPFLEYDFLIWIAKDFWEAKPTAQIRAALDHVLYHCGRDGEGRWYIRPHDVEDFVECIQRYGIPNNPWVEQALTAAVQGRLPLEVESRGKLESLKGDQIGKVKVEVKSFGVEPGPTTDEELYKIAVAMVRDGKAKPKAGDIQRHLRIGYPKAARIIDRMEAEMVVTIPDEKTGERTVVTEKVKALYDRVQELDPAGQNLVNFVVNAMNENEAKG